MWSLAKGFSESSWTEKAAKGFSEALEKTGEAVSTAANKAKQTVDAATHAVDDFAKSKTSNTADEEGGDTEGKEGTDTSTPSEEVKADGDNSEDKGSDEQQPQQTGRGLGGLHLPTFGVNVANVANPLKSVAGSVAASTAHAAAAVDRGKIFNNIQTGWSNVVETTKRSIDATKEAVEKEQSKLERNFTNFRSNRGGKRDPKLPLDVDALRDAEVVYITDRIITMSHPAMASSVDPLITAERKLAAVGHLLQRRHDGRFLVWNLSEVEYDVSILDDQVLTFSFPGSPSPPLGLLMKLLVSMENWMKADERNVAVVHCLTGRGRTSTVLAAFLCWIGEAGFQSGDINQALAYIADCKQLTPEELTIPSQRRYAAYFKNMLDGVRPSQPPLLLKRIIMSEAPRYAKGPIREGETKSGEGTKQDGGDSEDASKEVDKSSAAPAVPDEKLMGCAPYLQIFRGGQLVFTTAATLRYHQGDEELPFVQGIDGTVPFNVDQIIQGDILLRCRHLTFNKQRVSMFRSAFHTGYAPPNVMRLTKSQLDGACSDKRFPDDFFLDLIFEKVDPETATKLLENQQEEAEAEKELERQEDLFDTTGQNKKPVVKATSYDSMLYGDSRFWDIIANRRKEQIGQKNDDPNYGPTVGRRRGESKRKKVAADDAAKDGESQGPPKERTEFETFSIGNEFDFLPSEKPAPKVEADKPKEKDSLMDALNALDEDELEHAGDLGTEEIVFGDEAQKQQSSGQDPFSDAAATANTGTRSEVEAATATSSEQNPPSTTESGVSTSDVGGDETATNGDTNSSALDTASDDMDALLASADEDLGDIDLGEYDDDDDGDLEDLEKLLST